MCGCGCSGRCLSSRRDRDHHADGSAVRSAQPDTDRAADNAADDDADSISDDQVAEPIAKHDADCTADRHADGGADGGAERRTHKHTVIRAECKSGCGRTLSSQLRGRPQRVLGMEGDGRVYVSRESGIHEAELCVDLWSLYRACAADARASVGFPASR